MKNKILTTLLLGLFLISFVSAGIILTDTSLEKVIEDNLKEVFINPKVESVASVETIPYNTLYDSKSKPIPVEVTGGLIRKVVFKQDADNLSVSNVKEVYVVGS